MPRILVIDDEARVRELLRAILEKEGYEVTVAADGEEGFASYRAQQADLVITDLIMPKREGIETILGLRREYPDIKIIAISGGGRVAGGDYLLAAEKLGAQQTLAKPFQRSELLAAVETVLQG